LNLGSERYSLGVMRVPASGGTETDLIELVDAALVPVRTQLQGLGLDVSVVAFDGPPLASAGTLFEPLDYLEIGLAEKLERKINFLLIVTEGEMAASKLSYALAYPSRLTNVGLLSVRRLTPDFWGEEGNGSQAGARLAVLMLHTFGHLLNLDHVDDQGNVMHDLDSVEELDLMSGFNDSQTELLEKYISEEAHDETSRGVSARFWLSNIGSNIPTIGRTLLRANPLRLMAKLPTLLTAALSVVVILFFSPEVWEVAEAVSIIQIVLFIFVAIGVATAVMFKNFGFGTLLDRQRLVSESTVVTQATSFLAVALTVLTVWLVFLGLTYLASVTIFPEALVARWTPIESADETAPYLNLSLFLASMAVLTGSLGGKADSKRLVRTVLFLDEET
jgi:hypothetical protein